MGAGLAPTVDNEGNISLVLRSCLHSHYHDLVTHEDMAIILCTCMLDIVYILAKQSAYVAVATLQLLALKTSLLQTELLNMKWTVTSLILFTACKFNHVFVDRK